jgi:hypothetical protein
MPVPASGNRQQAEVRVTRRHQRKAPREGPEGKGRRRIFQNYRPEFSGQTPPLMSIGGTTFPVKTWKDVLLRACEIARARGPSEFSKILNLKGNKSPWFSRKPEDLRDPVRITGTDIFAETNQNANSLVLRSFHVLSFFGIDPKIDIELER